MKTKYFFTVPLYALLFLALQGFFLPKANSQTNEPASVGPSQHFFDNARIARQKPTQYLLGDALNKNEMHTLNVLTAQERKTIEESVDPPAIGVLRDLNEPIRFTLNATDIPAQGERSFSGGRLARINKDTLVWTTYIKSESAEELRIFFSEANFPDGVLVNLFSKDDYAFNQHELRGQLNEYGFYTTTTFADYVYIQVVIPVKVLNDNLYFVIPKVIHANNKNIPNLPLTPCYEDVNCAYANSYPNIVMLKESTSQLTFLVGSSYFICSGSLLNDLRGADWQPYLLTAHHCFSTQASANSLEARFDLFTTSCNGATNPNVILINGSNLLATNSQSDFTLVLLQDNPSGTRFYLGWTTGGVANDEILHSVNHPDGIPQKYMRGQNKTSPTFSCTGLSTSNFHYTRALGGESVGGSSGGNIVLPGGQVVGQLWGWCHLNAVDECDYPNFYNVWGKFQVSYNNNNLQYWLYGGGASVNMSTSPSSSLTFPTINVGSYQNLDVTVYNNGTVPNYLNLEAGTANITGTDAGQFSIIGPSFLYLDPGTSGTFTVRFTPTSSGMKTASFNIPHNADNTPSPRVITLTGYAQPCSDIISLGTGGSVNAKTYSKSGTGIWYTSWNTPCGYTCPGNEQIYSFVAPYTGYYSIEVTSSNNWIDYMWKASTCDGGIWDCIDDAYFPGTYGSMYWTAGNTYYILADAESTSLTTQTFYIFLNPCLNTVSIGGTGPGYAKTYNGGGNGAWYTSASSPCGWWCPGVEQVYSFVAPYTGYYSIQVTSTTEYYVDYLWSTSCGSTGWNCIQDIYYPGTYGSMYWTAGTTYYILLDDENTTVGPQTFYINAPNPCLGITSMSCGQAVEFAGGGPGVWNYYACGWSCPGVEHMYSFVAPTTGQYSIQVNAASGYYVDYMWSTSCSTVDWNCISDVIIPGQYGSMSWTAGTTYYILLDGEGNSPGTHSFQIVCPALCHDCPTYDFLISPGISWQTTSSSHDANGCKIYRFYANSGYHYTFKTGCGDGATADYDTYLQLFDATNCIMIAYDDDGCGYPLSKIEFTAGSSGYYYLKVRGFASYGGNYTLAYNVCSAAPSQPGAITGPTTVISGIGQAYSISAVPGATSYTWNYSGVGTIAGSGTSITLTPTGSGILSVAANNFCGSSPASDLSITVIPINLTLQNIAAIPGLSVCYEASLTIWVAGLGTFFFVPTGSSVEFVAGQNILFYPGTLVQNGGYLLGRIATTGNYCVQVPSKWAVNGEEGTTQNIGPAIQNKDSFFKVFPNPTTGNFILELSSEPDGTLVKVQCYNLMGSLIMEKEFFSGKRHEFTLIDQTPGLYVLKVIQNSGTGMQKIIKQ